jgi:hypothetical protein
MRHTWLNKRRLLSTQLMGLSMKRLLLSMRHMWLSLRRQKQSLLNLLKPLKLRLHHVTMIEGSEASSRGLTSSMVSGALLLNLHSTVPPNLPTWLYYDDSIRTSQ